MSTDAQKRKEKGRRNMKRKTGLTRALSLLMAAVLCLPGSIPVHAKQTNADTAATCEENATEYKIYPIPQSTTYTEGNFTLNEVAVVYEEGVDLATKNFLQEVLTAYDVSYTIHESVQVNKTNILLGIKDDQGLVDQYADENGITAQDTELYGKNDAYLLDASENAIVILGKDTDSVFYGVATLQMMFSSFAGAKFLNVHIEDYATIATRGYIEGFYGAWNFEERQNLMKFARDYKMNSYVYAAKGDAYHTDKWAEPYPTETLDELKELVKIGEQTKVKFAWSIHLGKFFKTFSSTSDSNFQGQYDKLMAKLNQLIGIGVKRIDILNDDFGGGSHETVVEVLNKINEDLKKNGCEPITYCPQGYNEAWSKWASNASELGTLKRLDPDIKIYWTGADVNAPITQETVNYLTEKSGHQPDFWLNYPVNEHAKSGIYLGDITYYARDGVTGLVGFHSNPCRYAYANEVGLYQLAALTWNNHDYAAHAQEIWESAFHYLQPEVKDSYFKIASNISNAPNSTRVPGFHESEYLAEKIATVENAINQENKLATLQEAGELVNEFQEIQRAVLDFRTNCANQNLVTELDPWLDSLNDLAVAGQAALESLLALEAKDASTGWAKLSEASNAYDRAYTHKVPADDLKDIAKAGTKRLSPFISKLINEAKNQLTPILNPNDTSVTPVLYATLGGKVCTPNDDGKKMYDGNQETYATWKINQKTGDYFGLDLGRVIKVTDITVLQGKDDTHHDIFHKARLEYSTNGTDWTTVEGADFSDGSAPHQISKTGLDIRARYVRMYLVGTGYNSTANYWTYVREFTVNQKVEETDRIYTNVETLKATPLTIEGAEISFRNLSNITLQPGEYVGIKLVDPAAVAAFKNEATANELTLEYSYNGVQWIEVSSARASQTVPAKYLRLINKTETAVNTNVQKVGMSVKYLEADPEFLAASIAGLAEGTYDNVFDGDLSTYILTSGNQQNQTYLTFDLGKTIEVHDVTAITTDGEQCFYHAKLQVSEDNAAWTDVATVANDSVMEVPYRYVRGDGNGVSARYFRILFTGDASSALKLYEIQINQNVEANQDTKQIITNLSGNVNALTDNNIATAFAGRASAGSYVEYRMTDNSKVEQISVLQGNAGTGKVYVVTASGERLLGTLDKSVSVFSLTEDENVFAIRLKWDAEEEIAIHEISVTYGENNSDDLGECVEPIIIETGEKPFINIASQTTVTVSGTTAGNKDYVKDGKQDTKWDSNAIKRGQGNNASDIGDAWLCFDFGTEKNYEINKIVVSFYNKIYPTSWVIQTSADGNSWTDVTETLTKANNGATHPIETNTFDTPISGRYVRLYFNTLNTAAGGDGVGVKEVEIYGREVPEVEAPISEQQNLALNKTVTVSGTELNKNEKQNMVDGNTDTRWNSNYIKGNDADSEAWAVIDLGTETNLIDAVNISYYRKVYPTRYQIQISNDNANWTTVKTLEKEPNGAEHPTDNIPFETPLCARYIRFLFTELNSGASGNCVGVTEAQVLGRSVYADISLKEVESVEAISLDLNTAFDPSVLPKTMKIKAEGSALTESLTMLVPVTWDTGNVDTSTAGTYSVSGILEISGVHNPESLKAQAQVVVIDEAPENPPDAPNQPDAPNTPNQPDVPSYLPQEPEYVETLPSPNTSNASQSVQMVATTGDSSRILEWSAILLFSMIITVSKRRKVLK